MLTVEEHFVIKELYRRGVSISEIARRTGHDRKTIRQRLTAPLLAEQAPHAPRTCKIDPYVPYLEQRLAEGVLNVHKLFSAIVAQGYPGGESQWRCSSLPSGVAAQPAHDRGERDHGGGSPATLATNRAAARARRQSRSARWACWRPGAALLF